MLWRVPEDYASVLLRARACATESSSKVASYYFDYAGITACRDAPGWLRPHASSPHFKTGHHSTDFILFF
jgi:hypothetical protein